MVGGENMFYMSLSQRLCLAVVLSRAGVCFAFWAVKGMSDLVTLDDVSVRYGKLVALQDITGVFHAGSLTAIAGPNGAGKSTLLKPLPASVKPRTGKVSVDPKASIAYLRKRPLSSTIFR